VIYLNRFSRKKEIDIFSLPLEFEKSGGCCFFFLESSLFSFTERKRGKNARFLFWMQ